MMISNNPKYGVGQEDEQAFTQILFNRGWCVVPLSTCTNNTGVEIGAPVMMIPGKGITVCPDLNGFHPTMGRKWFEIKGKTEPTYYRKYHRYEHGIDAPNFRDYLSVQEFCGEEVLLVVRERKSPIDANILTDMKLDPIGFARKIRDNLQTNAVDLWLYISLVDAKKRGEFRDGNRQMIKPRNPDGEGFYWPRAAMREFDL